MKRCAYFIARVLCRFHVWTAGICTLLLSGPFCELSGGSRSLFLYAITASRTSRHTRNSVAYILRRERNKSPDGNVWLALAAWRCDKLNIASKLLRRVADLGPGGEDAELAENLYALAEALIDGSYRRLTHEALLPVIAVVEPKTSIVLVPVTRAYIDFFRLWIAQVKKFLPAHVLVVALDEDAKNILRKEFDISVLDLSELFRVEDSGKLHRYLKYKLWILRTFLVRELVALGRQVIVLDLDAMPVGDIAAMLADLPKADIVAQIESHSLPVDAARKLGFILCCGFMVFYPTDATRRFMDRYAENVMIELDDQVALNHILVEEGRPKLNRNVRWTTFESAGVRWSCPSAELVSRNEFQGDVIRHFQQTGQTMDELKTRLGIMEDVQSPVAFL